MVFCDMLNVRLKYQKHITRVWKPTNKQKIFQKNFYWLLLLEKRITEICFRTMKGRKLPNKSEQKKKIKSQDKGVKTEVKKTMNFPISKDFCFDTKHAFKIIVKEIYRLFLNEVENLRRVLTFSTVYSVDSFPLFHR